MTNEEYEIAVARAEDFLDTLKDTCHDQYDKIKELKEENMFLRKKIKHYEKTITFKDYVEELNTLIDYKDRIDKAIEYIEKYYDEWMHSGEFISVIESNNRILDILKGSDK